MERLSRSANGGVYVPPLQTPSSVPEEGASPQASYQSDNRNVRSYLYDAVSKAADEPYTKNSETLCKYASGKNPTTGVSTRLSLGCGNSRRNAYGSPSSPLLSAPPQKLLNRDGFCDSSTGPCDAN